MEYSNSQIREVIEEWIHNDRDRLILRCDWSTARLSSRSQNTRAWT